MSSSLTLEENIKLWLDDFISKGVIEYQPIPQEPLTIFSLPITTTYILHKISIDSGSYYSPIINSTYPNIVEDVLKLTPSLSEHSQFNQYLSQYQWCDLITHLTKSPFATVISIPGSPNKNGIVICIDKHEYNMWNRDGCILHPEDMKQEARLSKMGLSTAYQTLKKYKCVMLSFKVLLFTDKNYDNQKQVISTYKKIYHPTKCAIM